MVFQILHLQRGARFGAHLRINLNAATGRAATALSCQAATDYENNKFGESSERRECARSRVGGYIQRRRCFSEWVLMLIEMGD